MALVLLIAIPMLFVFGTSFRRLAAKWSTNTIGAAAAWVTRYLAPTLRTSNAKRLVATAALLLVLLFIWPTPYQYAHDKSGSTIIVYRINRLTGNVEVLSKINEATPTKPRLATLRRY